MSWLILTPLSAYNSSSRRPGLWDVLRIPVPDFEMLLRRDFQNSKLANYQRVNFLAVGRIPELLLVRAIPQQRYRRWAPPYFSVSDLARCVGVWTLFKLDNWVVPEAEASDSPPMFPEPIPPLVESAWSVDYPIGHLPHLRYRPLCHNSTSRIRSRPEQVMSWYTQWQNK